MKYPDLLLKFIDRKYIKSYYKEGEIHLSRNKHFKEFENQDHIGDTEEGIRQEIFTPDKYEFRIGRSGLDTPPERMEVIGYKNAKLKETYHQLQDVPIACFTALSMAEDYESIGENSFEIKKEVIASLKGIGDNRPVVASVASSFIEQVLSKADELKIPIKMQKVKYYDEKIDTNISSEKFSKDPIESLFYKRNKYIDQREFRIVYKDVLDSDCDLKIGSIEKYSVVFETVDDLADLTLRF